MLLFYFARAAPTKCYGMEWMAYAKNSSQNLEVRKTKIKVPAESVSGGSSLTGLQTAHFLQYPHRAG